MISNKLKPVNEFPDAFMQELIQDITAVAKSGQKPLIAAFDADGTLWDTDVGESFFDYQIHNCRLPDMPSDPWKHYHDLKKIDPPTAYLWLAQINKGQSLDQVRAWAQACIDQQKDFPVFRSQLMLIEELKRLGFEIYIVTASVKWAVEPAARLVGVDQDHVLGITTKVTDGVVTSEPVFPVTWRDGKAQALLAETGDVRPALSSGNTYGDIPLLSIATHVRLAVSTQPEGTRLYEEEFKLRTEAVAKQWKVHPFR